MSLCYKFAYCIINVAFAYHTSLPIIIEKIQGCEICDVVSGTIIFNVSQIAAANNVVIEFTIGHAGTFS